jgi:hypothetical protein
MTGPELGRPVGVEFEAVVFGIREIDRFTHSVVGRALNRVPAFHDSPDSGGQGGAVRIKEGDVKQACCVRRRRLRVGVFFENEQSRRAACGR